MELSIAIEHLQAVRKAAEQRQQHSEPAEDPEKPLVPKAPLQKAHVVKPVVKIKQKQIQASQTQHDEATGRIHFQTHLLLSKTTLFLARQTVV